MAEPGNANQTGPMQLAAGKLLLGDRFRIVELAGRGGMGDVYLAEQISLGRKVALKVLREELSGLPGMRERFQREAQLLSTVEHPSVVRIIDYGESDGAYCLVMDFVEGESLAYAIGRGPLPPERAVPVLRQIAEGLEAIHSKGIVHRDLKPENVLLARGPRGEQPRLLDFGIAKLSEVDGSQPSLTQAGLVLGTPESISPEQAQGKQADCRSDVYSFGVLAFRTLTGTLPFPGPSVREYLMQHITAAPPSVESVVPALAGHAALCKLVAWCLEKSPEARPADGRALAQALAAVPLFPNAPLALQEVAAAPIAAPTPIAAASAPPPEPALAPPAPEPEPPSLADRVEAAQRAPPRRRLQLRLPSFGRAKSKVILAAGGALAIAVVVAAATDWTARKARTLLDTEGPAEALVVLETASPNPARLMLKAAALHRLKRHRDEWETLRAVPPPSLGKADELVLSGLAEDWAQGTDEALKKTLGLFPEKALGRLEEIGRRPPSQAQWGAVRYLDSIQANDKVLVELYTASLESADCGVLAVAANRLGQLGDARVLPALEAVRARPKKSVFVFQKSCGHDEADAAIAAIKKKK